ncbi:AfsA-related hotdog domain-containing protein [Nocardiopsis halotolerans]|uniref:AfsA-related hotdog domain-containing protein n=1 Tax=Nocardiopsis halotolerans TaxID=124252 RepID=UPI000346DEBC|nr:AfsA-related hotdog domain-containing protein [Nocardiopsis halotolerans]
MTVHAGEEVCFPPRELDFSQNIDRRLVHRSAVSEVFITDILPVGEDRVWCAAQLPLTHSYYNDHLQRARLFDPVLMVECCRQAAIAGSHSHMEIPDGTTMIVDHFEYEADWLPGTVIGRGPGELRVDTVFSKETSARTGRLRRGRVAQRLYVDDSRVGLHTMRVSFLKGSQAAALRHSQRGTPAPSTSQFREGAPPPLTPELVGRSNPANVVLSQPFTESGTVRATVTPWLGNKALFDHDYDHYPAMTLVEAARQLALLGTSEPSEYHPTAFAAEFLSYAELDAPLTARAERPDGDTFEPSTTAVLEQSGREVARISVALRRMEGHR